MKNKPKARGYLGHTPKKIPGSVRVIYPELTSEWKYEAILALTAKNAADWKCPGDTVVEYVRPAKRTLISETWEVHGVAATATFDRHADAKRYARLRGARITHVKRYKVQP